MSALLPLEFSQLDHLVADWAIEDGHQRYVKRVNSSMAEIQAFYDEVFPVAEEAVAYGLVDQVLTTRKRPGQGQAAISK